MYPIDTRESAIFLIIFLKIYILIKYKGESYFEKPRGAWSGSGPLPLPIIDTYIWIVWVYPFVNINGQSLPSNQFEWIFFNPLNKSCN